VVLDNCMLLSGAYGCVSGTVCAHSLQAEDVDLHDVAGHQLLMPGLVPSSPHFAWFHQSSPFISLGDSYCNTIDMAYNNYTIAVMRCS